MHLPSNMHNSCLTKYKAIFKPTLMSARKSFRIAWRNFRGKYLIYLKNNIKISNFSFVLPCFGLLNLMISLLKFQLWLANSQAPAAIQEYFDYFTRWGSLGADIKSDSFPSRGRRRFVNYKHRIRCNIANCVLELLQVSLRNIFELQLFVAGAVVQRVETPAIKSS